LNSALSDLNRCLAIDPSFKAAAAARDNLLSKNRKDQ